MTDIMYCNVLHYCSWFLIQFIDAFSIQLLDFFFSLGDYVIMVEDITSPPFLGHTLQTAFKPVRLIPDNGKGKNNRKSDMLTVPNS